MILIITDLYYLVVILKSSTALLFHFTLSNSDSMTLKNTNVKSSQSAEFDISYKFIAVYVPTFYNYRKFIKEND